MRSNPLVTAIMPTRGRRDMANQALHAFLAQTWPNKQLVIIDDAEDPSFAADPGYGVIYRRASSLTIGEKRNLAVTGASGEIIVHWDSDDRYHPERIEHQVNLLLADESRDIVGYTDVEFVQVETGERWNYRSGGRPVGVSLCYWRHIWEDRPFQDVNVGEEYPFMAGRRMCVVPSQRNIVATNHSGNTSQRHPEMNAAQWQRVA